MHTTSFDHKYQVGEYVWILDSEPENKAIQSIRFDTDEKIKYCFDPNVPWGFTEDKIYDSLIDARKAYAEQRKRSLESQMRNAKGSVESASKWIDNIQQELDELGELEN